MLIGHDNLVKTFKRLIKEDKLSHGYIFFGEPQVGKATFAKYMANFLEFGEFEDSLGIPTESLIITPDIQKGDNSIGIDAVRNIKQFLYSKPVRSLRRTVIIDNAETLTSQAQNAILKIAEEPPPSGLLILVLSNPEVVLPTLQSRFQKVYFPRASTKTVKNFLVKKAKIGVKDASKIAAISVGRIGRANDIALNEKWAALDKEVGKFLKGINRGAIIKDLIDPEKKDKLLLFLVEVISRLREDKERNYPALKAILKRLTFMSQFSVNKRLQLEAGLLWTT